MNEPQTYRTPVVCTLPAGDYSEARCRDACRHQYRSEVVRMLQALGFEEVEAVRGQGSATQLPDYTARRHNRRCRIYMPEVAGSVMRINHLSAAQCRHCEQHSGHDDIYFAALYLSCENELKMLVPYRIRRGGAWIESEEAEQFLPFAWRKHINSFAPLLGGAHVFKLVCIVLPILMNMGGKARFRVTGMSPDNEWREPRPPYTVLVLETAHAIFNLLHTEEGHPPRLVRPVFYHEEIAYCELELLSIARGGHSCVVELLARNGLVLRGESLDALVIPEYVPANRRYNWSLSLVAETCLPAPASNAWSVLQNDMSPHISITGRICRLHHMEVCKRSIPVAEVQFAPELPDHHICVYLAPEVTDTYTPAEGDTITSTGLLRCAPRNIVEGDSWQDSPEIAQLQTRRESAMHALHTYIRYAARQQAPAAVAAAFVKVGWQLCDFPAGDAPTPILRLASQRGEEITVSVHTAPPAVPPQADHSCIVRKEPHPEAGSYIAHLEFTPPCPGAPASIELPCPPASLHP